MRFFALLACVLLFASTAVAQAIHFSVPEDSAVVRGTITIATTQMPQVISANILVDGTTIATQSTAPIHYDTTQLANGPHKLTAQALDTNNHQVGSEDILILVENP